MSEYPTVFPIGHYLGVRQPHGGHGIRLGRAHHHLTDDEFGVWVLAHGSIESGRARWTTKELLAVAEVTQLADPPTTVDRLVRFGVLSCVEPTVKGTAAFAATHRMESLLVGIGNSREEPDNYRVGLPGAAPAAVLDRGSYELWQWGALPPTLWETCEVRAQVADQLGQSVDTAKLLDELLGDLRVLIANSCAYLDVTRSTQR